jgi:hypothetical protein
MTELLPQDPLGPPRSPSWMTAWMLPTIKAAMQLIKNQ